MSDWGSRLGQRLKPPSILVRKFPDWRRENLCRPSGTQSSLALYPGLTSWANIFRPYGTGVEHTFPPSDDGLGHTLRYAAGFSLIPARTWSEWFTAQRWTPVSTSEQS